jgi:hypothetical protein
MQTKERLYSRSSRVLNGWNSDPKFLSTAGLPLNLPIEASKQHRSFTELVDKYAAGNHPTTVLRELQRRGNVDLLDGDIVLYRSSATRPRGATESNVAAAALRVRRLGNSLFGALLEPDQSVLNAETKTFQLTAQQFAALIPELERNAGLYLSSVERQFQSQKAIGVNDDTKRVGVNVFSWKED